MVSEPVAAPYPVTLEVDYPETQSRWKTLLRLFLIIPPLLFVGLLSGGSWNVPGVPAGIVGSSIVLAIWATIILKARIVRWLFDFYVAVQRFTVRAGGYALLLTDEFPTFEGDYPIRYEVQFPDRLSRWKVAIWKGITTIPHYVVLAILYLSLIAVLPISWFAILFAGRFPRGLHSYVSGILRWTARVGAYQVSLTDAFPPYSLSPSAGPGSRDSQVASAILGVLGAAAMIAMVGGLVAFSIAWERGSHTTVSYAALETGARVGFTDERVRVQLVEVDDPASAPVDLIAVPTGQRLVLFTMEIDKNSWETWSGESHFNVRSEDFTLKYDNNEKKAEQALIIVGGKAPPLKIEGVANVVARLYFFVPNGEQPTSLRYQIEEIKNVTWDFQ